jgi:hypothetical protein
MNKQDLIKILKKENPSLSEYEIAQVYQLLIKLATIEFEYFVESNP